MISLPQPADPGQVRVENENELVSLMVRDGSLRHVIALVAETQRLNIVFATPADTIVTASFDRVPWQQAIDSLLSASGHSWTVAGGVIIVTSVADAKLLAPGASGLQTQVFELNFSIRHGCRSGHPGTDLTRRELVGDGEQPGRHRRTREAVVVVDYPANLVGASTAYTSARSINLPRQVLIEANILQIDLQDDRRSGIGNFEAIASFAGNDLTFSPVGFANAAASPAFFLEVSGTALTGLVELLKSRPTPRRLPRPAAGTERSGAAYSNRRAARLSDHDHDPDQFLGKRAVPGCRHHPDGHTADHPRRAGADADQAQSLYRRGDPETGLPSEKTTEVETDVIVASGQGVVIGGLIQERDINTQSKIPWLGDLPYVGVLFQRRQVDKSRAEIIVTLVPHVQPYTPMVACAEQFGFKRAQDRLTYGPLCRYPRPYEPSLSDTFTNPKVRLIPPDCRQSCLPGAQPPLVSGSLINRRLSSRRLPAVACPAVACPADSAVRPTSDDTRNASRRATHPAGRGGTGPQSTAQITPLSLSP